MGLLSSSKTTDAKLTPSIQLLPGGKMARLTYDNRGIIRSWDVTLTKESGISSLSLENLNAITDLFRKVVSENKELSKSLMQSHREGKPFVFNKSDEPSPRRLWDRVLGRDPENSVWRASQQEKDPTPINQPIRKCLDRLVSTDWFDAQLEIGDHLEGQNKTYVDTILSEVGDWKIEKVKGEFLEQQNYDQYIANLRQFGHLQNCSNEEDLRKKMPCDFLLGHGTSANVYLVEIGKQRSVARKITNRTQGPDLSTIQEYGFLAAIPEGQKGLITLEPKSRALKFSIHPEAEGHMRYAYDLMLCEGAVKEHCKKREDIELMLKNVLEGLKYIHDKGLCHGDIKPGNILMKAQTDKGAKKEFVLSDFGSLAPRGVKVNFSPLYGAPEQIAAEINQHTVEASFSADMFSLGVTLFELFEKILNTKTAGILTSQKEKKSLIDFDGYQEVFQRGNEAFPDCPTWQLMKEMLDREPAKRPTVDQAISRLQGK